MNTSPCCEQVEPKEAVTALIKAHDAFVPRRFHRAAAMGLVTRNGFVSSEEKNKSKFSKNKLFDC